MKGIVIQAESSSLWWQSGGWAEPEPVAPAVQKSTSSQPPSFVSSPSCGVVTSGSGKQGDAKAVRFPRTRLDRDAFDDLADGKLELGAGVEAGAGDKDVGTGAGGIAGSRNELKALYQLTEEGLSATYTVRLIKYSVLELDG